MTPPERRWIKSSFSSQTDCVEMAFSPTVTAIRDSKSVKGPVLLFSGRAWAEFIAGVKQGEFDG